MVTVFAQCTNTGFEISLQNQDVLLNTLDHTIIRSTIVSTLNVHNYMPFKVFISILWSHKMSLTMVELVFTYIVLP